MTTDDLISRSAVLEMLEGKRIDEYSVHPRHEQRAVAKNNAIDQIINEIKEMS